MVRSRAVIMHMVSGETPTTNLPQRAVVLIVVGQILIAFEAVWEGSGGPGPLTFLAREEVKLLLQNCSTLEAVATIFIDPL
jgi:hypothetical protein